MQQFAFFSRSCAFFDFLILRSLLYGVRSCRRFSVNQVAGGLIGDAERRRNELVRVRGSQSARTRSSIDFRCVDFETLNAPHFTFLNFSLPPAHNQTINNQRHTDEERNSSGHPNPCQNLCLVGCNVLRNSFHEYRQKDGQANADAARYHTAFDLVITFDLRRNTESPLHLELALFSLLAKHLGPPVFTPFSLFIRVFERQRLAHRFQVSPAKRAELHIVSLIVRTTRTNHSDLSS